MHINRIWLLILLLCQAPLPSMAAANTNLAAQPGYIGSEMIYDRNNSPTPQCHASTIADTPTGLVAAWFGGRHERSPDVGIWVSRRLGSTWSSPIEVANGVLSPVKRYPCWNPVLFKPQSGPLMLFYKIGSNPRTWWGMLMTSRDDGLTWSNPWRLGTNQAIGLLLGPSKNKPIQFTDGSILCPSSTEHGGWRVHFEVTSDLGKTWKIIGPIRTGRESRSIQPTILTYPDGRIQILCRTRDRIISQDWSGDGGRDWGPLTATSLPNPNSGLDAVTLKDGRQLLVYNDTTRTRSPLAIAISSDGRNWSNALVLENQPGEYSYPAVIQARDGRVHVTYTYRRQTIKHVEVDPAALGIPQHDGIPISAASVNK